MKKLLLLVTVALMAMSTFAAPVDQARAMRMAKSYLTNELYAGQIMAPAALNPVLLKMEVGDNKLNQPVYYIYNTSTTFLVIAGDDRAENILMVGDEALDPQRIPDGMQYLLDCYKEQISYLQEHPDLQVKRASDNPRLRDVTYGPLLKSRWDQMSPYWKQCVFTYSGTSYQCLTGCPATSASQIMYYWKYPESVGAMASYNERLELSQNQIIYSYSYPSLPATTFDWDNMKDRYNNYTSAQADAVATLMRYVGQAEKMMYGTVDAGGSGILTTSYGIYVTMFKNWGYKTSVRAVSKGSYTENNWANLIIGEMSAKRPVLYMGVDYQEGGHAFNVDGYRDSDSKFHVNFGWSGSGDSWYAMNAFTTDGCTFNQNQRAIVGIESPNGLVPDPVLTITPSSLNFTDCHTGETYTKTLTISAADLRSDVTFTSNNEAFTVSPSTLTAAQAQAGATVTVTYSPTTAGTHTGAITVSTIGLEDKTISVSGSATTVPKIIVNPTTLNLSTTVGVPVTQTFTVTGTNLTGSVYLSCSGAGFTIDKTMITKSVATQGTTVTVTYNPTATGSHTGTVTLTSGVAQTVVQLNGTAVGGPTIIANPDLLIFDTTVGTPVTQTFTVTGTNLSGSVYLACSGEGFTIDKSTITKTQATNGATVTVTYSPTAYGNHLGTVTLTSSGAQAVTVDLDGMADIVVYNPVMLPANQEYIGQTYFRADWTDATLGANVLSYTLDVQTKTRATETGNATYRRVTGITDKFFTVNDLTAGATFLYKVKAIYVDGTESDWSNVEEVTLLSPEHGFVPGDVNHDGSLSIADVTMLITYVLSNGSGASCPVCADVNGDYSTTIADVTILIGMVLNGGN